MIEVNRDVLIHRPDTETLVVEALALLKERDRPRVLDVGTGSGCIAVAIAVNHGAAQVTAVDASDPALAVAARNAERHSVADRIEFRYGDLFAPVARDAPFDLVVSNPPYVSTAEIEQLAPDVRDHEPRAALDGGMDGLDVIRRITDEAGPHVVPGGWLLVECSPEQTTLVAELLTSAGFAGVVVRQDLAGRGRAVCGRKAET
jgi:release factor glutamine methyltransferase